ncbi:uncharacterized protein PAC_00528 [Phialocephala subalpina]|uniref:Cupin 2 conserved barrel domain-containing protein n=1 Tax=Phialocephala subalpina TaxID=576137 RepID=A0A1L7WCY7_9HELO|nr:uncharacterized protein PAC_00528 [Phialocephala subalpina]
MAVPNIITTSHNNEGLSVFIESPEYKALSPYVGILYSSDGEPVNLNGNADLSKFNAHHFNDLIPKQGNIVLVAEWPAATDSRDHMHRTLSVDVGVMLSGSVECHLDSGESRLVRPGDVLLQRGTKHAWVNHSLTETARMLCFVMPSQSVEGAKA